MEDSTALRALPAVHTLLGSPAIQPLLERYGRAVVTDAVRDALQRARALIRAGVPATVGPNELMAALAVRTAPSLRRVINGTGVILHTNLGRAPLAPAAQAAVLEIAGGYSNLELDLAAGARGERHAHVGPLLSTLTGAEAGLALNNCAGAVLLMLAALCRGREVIVARGELVEIGGGFRVPEIMSESGATLIEVGTTNKVYAHDYERVLSPNTGAILVVHRSNFALLGFTHQPALRELAAVAHKAGVPLLVDLGSGLLADAKDLGAAALQVQDEPRPRRAIEEGADLVAFSGDKLLGGPQAGLLIGRQALIERVKRHPLARALRADKLTLAALVRTLELYRDGQAQQIPALRMMATPIEVLRAKALRLAAELRARLPQLPVTVADGTSVPGGGSLPLVELPSALLLLGEAGAPGRQLAKALREAPRPVITRTHLDRVAVDVRTVEEEDPLVEMVENAAERLRVEPSTGMSVPEALGAVSEEEL
jgi:L-seryl-tRNA(Ser) seleniumtransferase